MNNDGQEDKVLLTEEQVWDVIEFARSMSSGMYGMTYLNPELVSGRMKDVTLNPVAATQDALETAMKDPKSNERHLQEFSQSFELTSMVYKRLIAYLANMLAFDITYTSNAEPEDYKTPKYKKDLKLFENFIDRFDYKKEFKIAVREMLRNDAYFACVRDTGDKIILQELPSEYCKITGRWEGGFLFSFNMYWFLQPGVDVEMYPPFFKKKYNELWGKDSKIKNYNPTLPPEVRDRSSWIYWVDIPVTFGVCFKLTPELATRLPYFTPLFNDLILQPLVRNLQKNMNMAAASKMIMGEVPMLNKETKATVKDSIAISPDLLGKFLALLKSGISEAIKVGSAPLTDIQGISFDTDATMYDSYLRTALASSGVNTNLIFSSSVKPNAIETQLSLNVDEQMMTALYPQFEYFMDYHSGKITRGFRFYTEFEGTEFFLDRKARLDTAMELFGQGMVLPQKIAAAVGMKPSRFRKHMEEAKANGFMETLTPPSIETQRQMIEVNPSLAMPPGGPSAPGKATPKPAGQKSGAGRPRKDISEVSDEGLKTRESGSNIGRGGKV